MNICTFDLCTFSVFIEDRIIDAHKPTELRTFNPVLDVDQTKLFLSPSTAVTSEHYSLCQ